MYYSVSLFALTISHENLKDQKPGEILLPACYSLQPGGSHSPSSLLPLRPQPGQLSLLQAWLPLALLHTLDIPNSFWNVLHPTRPTDTILLTDLTPYLLLRAQFKCHFLREAFGDPCQTRPPHLLPPVIAPDFPLRQLTTDDHCSPVPVLSCGQHLSAADL